MDNHRYEASAAMITLSVLFTISPHMGIAWATTAIGTILLTALPLARSPLDFIKLAPLHLAVVITFGVSILSRALGEPQSNG